MTVSAVQTPLESGIFVCTVVPPFVHTSLRFGPTPSAQPRRPVATSGACGFFAMRSGFTQSSTEPLATGTSARTAPSFVSLTAFPASANGPGAPSVKSPA